MANFSAKIPGRKEGGLEEYYSTLKGIYWWKVGKNSDLYSIN